MIVAAGSFDQAGQFTPWMKLTGRVSIWRGPGNGVLILEQRSVTGSLPRFTGDTLSIEGSAFLQAGMTGGVEYRIACRSLTGSAIEWEISQ